MRKSHSGRQQSPFMQGGMEARARKKASNVSQSVSEAGKLRRG